MRALMLIMASSAEFFWFYWCFNFIGTGYPFQYDSLSFRKYAEAEYFMIFADSSFCLVIKLLYLYPLSF
jgi:hypothetical protein